MLAVGDGALEFWKALREVFPDTREQRCWFHVQGNDSPLPKSAHAGAKAALAEDLRRRGQGPRGRGGLRVRRGSVPSGKAAVKITDHLNGLLAFYAYHTEH